MNRNEILFFASIIILYIIFIILSPAVNAYMLLALLLIGIVLMLMFKFKGRFENYRIHRILQILSLISIILYIIASTYESYAHNIFIISSGTFIFLFAIFIISSWFFGKKEDEELK